MPEQPSAQAVLAWSRLLRTSQRLLGQVEAALKGAGLPPLVWYDVLHELAGPAAQGLRPYTLEARMLLPQYNVSRLLGRMEAAGVLERMPHPEDGRGQVVRITPAGRDLRRRMWAVYGPAIARAVDAPLAAGEAGTLAQLLARLGPAPHGSADDQASGPPRRARRPGARRQKQSRK